MKITTEIYKKAYKEVNKYLMPRKIKNNNNKHILIAILIIITSIIFKLYVLTIAGSMILITNVYIHTKLLKEQLNRNIQIFDKLYNSESYSITLQFKDDHLVYLNHKYKKEYSIDYKEIRLFKQTKNYYVIITNNDTYLIIDKKDGNYKKIKEYLKK